MPSLSTSRHMHQIKNNNAQTVGQIVKEQSDFLMEDTWWNDPQSKVCYIYDYKHDDQPNLNKGMTYETTDKCKIDAKFIVAKYQTISGDQIEYHILFRPSQKRNFSEEDELFYYEEEYVFYYRSEFPIGLYIDIPDDQGIYRKYLIVGQELANQFVKFFVLPLFKLGWSSCL